MTSKYFITAACIAWTAGVCNAQRPPAPEQPWSERPVMRIWAGIAPGSEHDTRKEMSMPAPVAPYASIVTNVTVPTVTVFQPRGGNTTGTAVLICPGGAFRLLAIDQEGYQVADWFSQHGVTAFVLKYRVAELPPFTASASGGGGSPEQMDATVRQLVATLPKDTVPMAIADGVQALKVVRQNAGKFGYRPDRIVALGFSAGGGVVTGTASAPNPSDRPNYVAPMYGALLETMPTPPKDAPPFFLTLAEDDPLVQGMVMRLFTSLRDAGGRPEFHLYRSGAHGFSMQERGTSDHWLQELWWWMESFGLTKS